MLCLGYRRVGLWFQRGLGSVALHPEHHTLNQLAPGHEGGSRLFCCKAAFSPSCSSQEPYVESAAAHRW